MIEDRYLNPFLRSRSVPSLLSLPKLGDESGRNDVNSEAEKLQLRKGSTPYRSALSYWAKARQKDPKPRTQGVFPPQRA